jgi:hypothetical protein
MYAVLNVSLLHDYVVEDFIVKWKKRHEKIENETEKYR